MTDSPVRIAPVRRVAGARGDADADLLAVEEPLQLEVEYGDNPRRRLNLGVLLRTPGRDEDLATGLLLAEGFIRHSPAILGFSHPHPGHLLVHLSADIDLDTRLATRVLVRASACGLCGRDAIDDLFAAGGTRLPDGPCIRGEVLHRLPAALGAHQALFKETGGLHAVARFDAAGACLASAEDVGRHNAFDKLAGAALRAGAWPLEEQIVLVSGRPAFELVHKAVIARASVLAAIGAPTSLAVETARAANLTLVGFLRDNRFNIYSGVERIV